MRCPAQAVEFQLVEIIGGHHEADISYIDSYAKTIIEKYFLQKYERDSVLSFEYDYVLLQKMLVKYAFNDSRSRKYDLSFFDRSVIDWLLNEGDSNPKSNITG